MRFFRFSGIRLAILVAALLPAGSVADLNVVTTTPDVASIAETVGGERVEVTSLARGAEDPHFVAPRPSFIRILNRADVLIEGGAELEAGWLPPLVRNARNRNILPGQAGHIALARHVEMIDVPRGPIDRSMGDVHASGNPHFMLDPKNAGRAAEAIAELFSELDPDGRDVYAQNLEQFLAQIDEQMKEWKRALAPFEGTQVVTYHKNYDYLARRFGFEVFAQIEPLPGVEPSPRQVTALILSMRENDVRLVWMEPFRSRRTAARIAEQAGAKVVLLPEQVSGADGADDYLSLIAHNVNEIVQALSEEE